MLAAVALVVAAAVHTASHLLNTIPMLVSETNLTVLNANTKCTICANNEVCCILLPRVLQYPTCPFDALPTYKEVLFKSHWHWALDRSPRAMVFLTRHNAPAFLQHVPARAHHRCHVLGDVAVAPRKQPVGGNCNAP